MNPSKRGFGRAVVMGGSIAGLLSARVLSEHFEKVVILEREVLPEGPEARKAVPQGRHIHAMLEAGLKVLEALYPGLLRELEAGGADRIDMGRDGAWFHFGAWKPRFVSGYETILCSRPYLEWKVRGRTVALPNVELRQGYAVQGLLTDASRARVTGVRVEGPDGEETLEADLVVDASGRGSRAPQWLEQLGYGRPEEEQVGIELAYTSRFYERPAPPRTIGRAWPCTRGRRTAGARASSPTWREGGGSSASAGTSETTPPRMTRGSWSSPAACPPRTSTRPSRG